MIKHIAPLAVLLMMRAATRPKLRSPVTRGSVGLTRPTDAQLAAKFADIKTKGIDGLLYSAGHDPETYRRVGKIAQGGGHGI